MQAIKINPEDVVAVALTDLKQGQEVKLENDVVILQEDIPRGHKFALYDLDENDPVIKYGYPIGRAKHAVKKGEHVHTQNVKTDLKAFGSYNYDKAPKTELKHVDRYFDGYVRSNGDVGIRNEIWIIPTVFCVNHVAKELESYAQSRLSEFVNVDDCLALTHPYGCSQMGEDQTTTQKILACLTRHPNAGAVLVLGLGCENNNIGVFKEFLNANDDRIHFLNSQDVEDELTAGKSIIDELLVKVNAYKRQKVSIDKLRIGLKCGGSDGLSGITANPLIGRLSDVVVGSGGTSVMTEVPEMFGAEQILMNRAVNSEVFDKCVKLINDFKNYFSSHGQVVSENPSPGNKAGGITTLEDKSLGCVQKGGKAEVCDVLKYGESLRSHGLNLLQGPGNDGVSCTALASAGCHMVLFSTGRGTPFATAIPTVKISTNTALFNKKQDWIDFNAGAIVDGTGFDELTDKLLDYVLEVASGKKTLSEKRGFHDIIIWKDGVTL
ncbi:UxaA family hydrolase [Succinatimonas hippei]|uniref:SAF domain protein n=1 Tax=Succinatimonas hippei (strain DSM 22608 / JCM 16073 / KCTC 15190 / YIT 12066) TaxID=762983 RepID=E8LM79_SUCHY|nr:altronate dehydratase family protein [Succinatimonas hippei]EFY06351.1 SAF domain protein [Succinatimonas hippei YIT 12066]